MSNTLEQAQQSMLNRRFDDAKQQLDQVIASESPETNRLSALLMRARGYEDGLFAGGKDFDAALSDFARISASPANEWGFGQLGEARMLWGLFGKERRDEIRSLCLQSFEMDRNPKAMMVLGLAYEQLFEDDGRARDAYLTAYEHGRGEGLVQASRLLSRKSRHWEALKLVIAGILRRPKTFFARAKDSPYH